MAGKTAEPDILTYRQIVMSNPPRDIRTFTNGTTGYIEASFYRAHQLIEGDLHLVRLGLEDAGSFLQEGNTDAAIKSLGKSAHSMDASVAKLGKMHMMSPEDFSAFRRYFTGHSGLNGPSGLYSHGIPIMDLLLVGSMLPDEYSKGLIEGLTKGYYPERKIIADALKRAQNNQSLIDFAERLKNPTLFNEILALAKSVMRFRGAHYGVVKKQLPEAVNNEVTGTGGQDNPGTFLRGRVAAYQQIIIRIQERVDQYGS